MNKQHIKYGIEKFFAGYFLAVFNHEGLVHLELSKSKKDLLSFLDSKYEKWKKIELKRNTDRKFNDIYEQIQNPGKNIVIPIHTKGTAFQKKVWKSLSNIKAGETKSYSQIAEEIGNPKSFRAVANACSNNKIAILIPCHRVINKNGDLGGYRWGIDLKKEILQREKCIIEENM